MVTISSSLEMSDLSPTSLSDFLGEDYDSSIESRSLSSSISTGSLSSLGEKYSSRELLDLDRGREYNEILERLRKTSWQKSMDAAGHGGTFTATVDLSPDKRFHLFLKPKDETEGRNYQIITRTQPELARHMPQIYGEIERFGTSYLVMENVLLGKSGSPRRLWADIKLAGKVFDPKFNPIASQEEMRVTRGEGKGWFDFGQMKLGSDSAPNYMIALGPKLLRFTNYHKSEQTLKGVLKEIHPVFLRKLNMDLINLKVDLLTSKVAMNSIALCVHNVASSSKCLIKEPSPGAMVSLELSPIQPRRS